MAYHLDRILASTKRAAAALSSGPFFGSANRQSIGGNDAVVVFTSLLLLVSVESTLLFWLLPFPSYLANSTND